MSWRSHPIVVALRSVGRKLGINRLLANVASSSSYEHRFRRRLLGSIRPGDCVWDVGANVGFYTKRFASLVGEHGRVVAFEPSPDSAADLRRAVDERRNVAILPVALGDSKSTVPFRKGEDELSATSRIVEPRAEATETSESLVRVEMARGDELIRSERACHPNVVKIDTEGYELDVLRGLSGIMESPSLRTVCVEVHFSLLEERGLRNAPASIERLLRTAGFRCEWADSSHIVATRERSEQDHPASH